jgi:hypothetical protein
MDYHETCLEFLRTFIDRFGFGYNRTKVNEIVVEELNAFWYLDVTCFDTICSTLGRGYVLRNASLEINC